MHYLNSSIRVLHVVDRVTGGVPVAVADYIRNSPAEFSHTILSPFVDGKPAPVWGGVDATLLDLGEGHIRRVRSIRNVHRREAPQVVHAHSSFSGAYTRVSIRRGSSLLVYTPHCFAFERRDLRSPLRGIYRAVEWVLALNTDVLAACGPGEATIASKLRPLRGKTAFIPNVTSLPVSSAADWTEGPLRLAMLGRISAQKDPDYFREAVRRIQAHGVPVEATWIGSGDETSTERLERDGVRVTGWLDSVQLRNELRSQHVYVHTAAWEGFPLAILDAYAIGLPILARRIKAIEGISEDVLLESGIAPILEALTDSGRFRSWRAGNRVHWERYLLDNTPDVQRNRLREVWTARPST